MPRFLIAAISALALALSGCGGSDEPSAPAEQAAPPAQAADFPSAEGRTLQDLQSTAEEKLVLAPSVSVLKKGTNRFGFAVFDTSRKQIPNAAVALYVARPDGSGLQGPFLARSETLAVEPEFQSTTTSSDEDAAKGVYVADVEFAREGEAVVFGLAQHDGGTVSLGAQGVVVGRGREVPDVGEKAIRMRTETIASASGDLEALTTRRPPARELLKDDFAAVLGKKPVVLTFATPLLCASRVCGPVVDIVEQVRARTDGDVSFIQQEIYKDNKVDAGVRPQVAKWRLPSEPWTFVIDREGIIRHRFEGAFSAAELERAVADVA